jgi:hypothetical protein
MAAPERGEFLTFWARELDFEEFPTRQLSETGDSASVRSSFAFFHVNE